MKICIIDHYPQYDSGFVYVNELTTVISKLSVRLLVIFSFSCKYAAFSRKMYAFDNNKLLNK